jgi:hypothetical protein
MFRKQILKTSNIGKNDKQTTVQLSKTDSSMMSIDDVRGIYESIENQAANNNEDIKCSIRALNISNWITLKSFAMDDLNEEVIDEYLQGLIKEGRKDKFNNFSQIQVTVFKKK